MWYIWLARKTLVFNGKLWTNAHLGKLICESFIDYNKFARQCMLIEIERHLNVKQILLIKFDRLWCPHHTTHTRDGRIVKWTYQIPKLCSFV